MSLSSLASECVQLGNILAVLAFNFALGSNMFFAISTSQWTCSNLGPFLCNLTTTTVHIATAVAYPT